jgi:hypothetical protein
MPEKTKEQIVERSQLLRAYDSCCRLDDFRASPTQLALRDALAKRIGLSFDLREMRTVTIQSGTPTPRARA